MAYKFARGQYVDATYDKKTATPGGTFRVINVSAYHSDGTVYSVHSVDDPDIRHPILLDEGFLVINANQSDAAHGQRKL